jgi:hypothetical protein
LLQFVGCADAAHGGNRPKFCQTFPYNATRHAAEHSGVDSEHALPAAAEGERVQTSIEAYAISLAALVAAVLLRWLLDP